MLYDPNHPQKFRRLLPAICRYCDRGFFYKPGDRPSALIGPFSPEQHKRLAELRAQISADLSIPVFMRRGRP
jgi:hypothetical protein